MPLRFRSQGMWLGAALSTAFLQRLQSSPVGPGSSWTRTNFRGKTVDMYAGPALALAAATSSVVAGAGWGVPAAALGAAAVGRIDDVRGASPAEKHDKGLAGHARAIAEGRVSAGAIKVVGLIGVGAISGALGRPHGRKLDLALDAACIAGMANLINLFDLRPGRALKVGGTVALISSPFVPVASGIGGAALGVLASDLSESTMLGDAGANALGAALGAALVHGRGRGFRLVLLSGVAALTVASERVSFSAVIEGTPILKALDELGRPRD